MNSIHHALGPRSATSHVTPFHFSKGHFRSLIILSLSPIQANSHQTALEGLAAVVTCGLVPLSLPGSIFYVHACHPCGALPASGLAGCPVGRGE